MLADLSGWVLGPGFDQSMAIDIARGLDLYGNRRRTTPATGGCVNVVIVRDRRKQLQLTIG